MKTHTWIWTSAITAPAGGAVSRRREALSARGGAAQQGFPLKNYSPTYLGTVY